jgi:hypothetical protein
MKRDMVIIYNKKKYIVLSSNSATIPLNEAL